MNKNFIGVFIGVIIGIMMVFSAMPVQTNSAWWDREVAVGGTLENDNPGRINEGSVWVDVSADPKFKVPTYDGYYTALALKNTEAGDDYDLFIFNDYELEDKIADSTLPSDEVDFVVVNGHTNPGGYKYAIVSRWSGGDHHKFSIESDCHAAALAQTPDPTAPGILEVGTSREDEFEVGDLADGAHLVAGGRPLISMYDVYLYAGGEYTFAVSDTGGLGGDSLGGYLYLGSGGSTDYLASGLGGGGFTFDYAPTSSGWYGFLVVDHDGAEGTYDVLVTSDFNMEASPDSRLIGPGSTANYTVSVESLGAISDITLTAEWADSDGTPNSSANPGGTTDINFTEDTLTPTTIETVTTTMRVETDNAVSDGTYYINITAAGGGEANLERYYTVKLVISSDPDFLMDVSPVDKSISQGSQEDFDILIYTINDFDSNITLGTTITSGPSPNYLNTSDISPNPINESTGYQSVLTIVSNNGGTTPEGDYTVQVTGSGGSLVRSANISLHVGSKIELDIIDIYNGELLSGTVTFTTEATATPPNEVSEVYFNFGGVMAPLGTVEAYYNPTTGFWERDINTNAYSDGAATINVTAIDKYGSSSQSDTISFTISNTAPSPLILTPFDKEYVTDKIEIIANTSSNVVSAMYRIDTNAYQPLIGTTSQWSTEYDTTLSTDGAHDLTVWAKNAVGLVGTTTITIYIDNTAPTGIINSPLDKEYIQDTYTVRIVAIDAVAVDHVELNIFNSTVTIPYNPLTASYEYTFSSITKEDGTYTLNAIIHDKVGQSYQTENTTFNIDNNPPSLLPNNIKDGTILSGPGYNLSVTSEDTFLNKVEYRIDYTNWVKLNRSSSEWNYLIDTTQFTDGAHTMTIRAVDNASHTTSTSFGIFIDNHPPVCTIVSPQNGEIIYDTYRVRATAVDEVEIDNVILNISGEEFTMNYNSDENIYEYQLNTKLYEDGTYLMFATATDTSGNTTFSNGLNINIDNTFPTLELISPLNGDVLEGQVFLNVSSFDVFLNNVEYNIDNTGWRPIDQMLNTTDFSDGAHTIKIRATDMVGHETSQEVDILIDNNAPICSLTAPVTDEFIEGDYTFRMTAYDAVGIDNVILTLFGQSVYVPYNAQTGYYEYNINTVIWTEDGVRNASVYVEDVSGKSAEFGPVEFNVDNQPPKIKINYPVKGSFVSGEVVFDAEIYDAFDADLMYNIDGSGWKQLSLELLHETTWLTNESLDGEHVIYFKSTDRAGHVTETSVNVIVDNHYPTGSIIAPVTGSYLQDEFTVKVSAEDAVNIARVEATVFNNTYHLGYNSGSGYYEMVIDTKLHEDGEYTLNAIVSDTSGKSVSLKEVKFKVDNEYPDLSMDGPKSGSIVGDSVSIDVNANDLYLDKVQYSIDEGGWVDISEEWNTTGYNDGSHTIKVRAHDEIGHYVQVDTSVIVDNTQPTLGIITPISDAHLNGLYDLRVSADDLNLYKVTVSIDGSQEEIMNKDVSGKIWTYTMDTEKMTDGTHTIQTTAYDVAGNDVSRTTSIYVDNTGPELNLTYVWEGKGDTKALVFSVTTTDPSGVDGVYLNIDSTGWREMTPSKTDNTSYTLIWSVGEGEAGEHVFQARAVDDLGNEAMTSDSIGIKEKKEEVNYLKSFQEALPTIWFILFLVIIIVIVIIIKKGYYRKNLEDMIEKIESSRKPPTVIVSTDQGEVEREEGDILESEEEPAWEEDYSEEEFGEADYGEEKGEEEVEEEPKPKKKKKRARKKKKSARRKESEDEAIDEELFGPEEDADMSETEQGSNEQEQSE